MARKVPPVGNDVIVALTAEGKPLPLAADFTCRWRAGQSQDWSFAARSTTPGLLATHEAKCRRIWVFTLNRKKIAYTMKTPEVVCRCAHLLENPHTGRT